MLQTQDCGKHESWKHSLFICLGFLLGFLGFFGHTLNDEKEAEKVALEALSMLGDVAVGGVSSSVLNVVHKLIETRCSLCFWYGATDLFFSTESKLNSVLIS